MPYDAPWRQTRHTFLFDAGNNGNETFSIKGPKGKEGRLINYGIEGITEVFVADCTIAVGTAANPDAFGEEMAIGAAAVDTVVDVRSRYAPGTTGFDALIVDPDIPADTLVQVTIVDDTTSGIGTFFAEIDWAN